MRLLIISPTYYPSFYPRAFRWTALSEHFVSQGVEVDIITSRVHGQPNQETINGVNVFRVSYSSFDKVSKSEHKILSSEPQTNNFYYRVKKFLKKSLKTLWRSIYWPDGAIIWYPSASVKALQLLKKHKYNALISVSNPFTAHLVGLLCKRKYPDLDWVIDIGDPFYLLTELPLNNFALYRNLNRAIEAKVLRLASKITCTVEETANIYKNEFPFIHNKILVIPPLLTPGTTNNNDVKRYFPDKQLIKISYVGGFYKNIREPTKALQLLRLVAQTRPELARTFRVYFFGSTTQDIYEIFEDFDDIKELFELKGGVPREDILGVISNSDVLINIANTTGYQLPSKSVDYMYSCKPIINVCHSNNDSFKKFFEDYPICFNLVIPDSPRLTDVDEFIQILERSPGLQVDKEKIKSITDRFTVQSISSMYLNLIGL